MVHQNDVSFLCCLAVLSYPRQQQAVLVVRSSCASAVLAQLLCTDADTRRLSALLVSHVCRCASITQPFRRYPPSVDMRTIMNVPTFQGSPHDRSADYVSLLFCAVLLSAALGTVAAWRQNACTRRWCPFDLNLQLSSKNRRWHM